MPAARVGLHRDRWHRYAFNNSPWYPGVTGICKVQDNINGSDSLINWAVNIALDAALQAAAAGLPLEQAKAVGNEARNHARDRGTAVHAGIEAQIGDVDFIPTDEQSPFWYGWSKFLLKEKPEIIANEQRVINLTAGFGGTVDLIANVRGKTALIDAKTGPPKDGHVLQLAGYSAAEFMGDQDDPEKHPLPEFDAYYVLALMSEAPYYELVPLAVGDQEREHFLFLTKTHHQLKAWAKGIKTIEEAAA